MTAYLDPDNFGHASGVQVDEQEAFVSSPLDEGPFRTSPARRRKRSRHNPAYDGLDVADFLRSLGVRNVKRRGNEVSFSCPGPEHRRGDLNPSASMRTDTTQFKCFHCSDEFEQGNAATFLVDFLKVTEGEVVSNAEATKRLITRDYFGQDLAKPRARTTTRQASGSLSDLHERATFALELLDKGVSYTRIKTALMEYFAVSRATAERDIASAKGLTLSRIMQVEGKPKVINKRRMSAARLVLRVNHKEMTTKYEADISNTLSRIGEVEGKQDEQEAWFSDFVKRCKAEKAQEERLEQQKRVARQQAETRRAEERHKAFMDYFHGRISDAEYEDCLRRLPKVSGISARTVGQAKAEYARENEIQLEDFSLWDHDKALARL
jgi:hypothetical protein